MKLMDGRAFLVLAVLLIGEPVIALDWHVLPLGGQDSDPDSIVRVRAPNGGEHYGIGDTLKVHWEADPEEVFEILVMLSPDLGRTWKQISSESIENTTGSGVFEWVIEPEIEEVSLVGDQCLVLVAEYFLPYSDVSDAPFTITDANGHANRPFAGRRVGDHDCCSIHTHADRVSIRVDAPGEHRVVLFSIAGSALMSWKGSGPGVYHLPGGVSTRPRVVRVKTGGRWLTRVLTPGG